MNRLEEAAHKALESLLAWQRWEAGIVNDDGCWGPSGQCDIQDHLEALTPLQEARNAAVDKILEALGEERP